ncbi:MAG TPA: hypothetical protein VF139_06090 [Candidatus Polarisedimenticolaceae bacterium]
MAWSDIQVSVRGVSGDTVTLSATNPNNHPETARVAVAVTLFGGVNLTLQSGNLTFGANETLLVPLQAPSAILSIDDAPEPLPPV